MSEQQPGPGRGYSISQRDWPTSGATRKRLDFCNEAHEKNGKPSLRQMEGTAHLSASQVGVLLRGKLPLNEVFPARTSPANVT